MDMCAHVHGVYTCTCTCTYIYLSSTVDFNLCDECTLRGEVVVLSGVCGGLYLRASAWSQQQLLYQMHT